jgi:predicted nuclease of predicted toxin-antitoxin system
MSAVLRFLADESCDFAVVRALRAHGFDVFAVAEVMTRSDDQALIVQAERERRVLLTEDKDFGWLVFASQFDSADIILIRFPGNARELLTRIIIDLVQAQGNALYGAFVVVQPGHTRIRRVPDVNL